MTYLRGSCNHFQKLCGGKPILEPQLQIRNLSKRFGGIIAVKDINVLIEKGEILSIIGPNGAGKTTFFNLVTGFYPPDQGDILLEGTNLSGISPHRIAKAGIARTFQNIRLFPWMTVLDNLIVACQMRCSGGLLSACFKTPIVKREEKATLRKAEKIISYFELQNKWNYQAKNLPYGEQRKLEIARALALDPKILLLDEPTAGMNLSESEECVETIFKINEEMNITIILIEHNMNVVMGISDRVIVLDHGVKISEGYPEEIQNDENVIKAYLGEDYFGNA
jgi:branched-chain amino acid transport system ATP-binding protein